MLKGLDKSVVATENHCQALDNYLDKYQPVRMQNMISDTLYACLQDEERREHELYDVDKLHYLYELILQDDGKSSNI